MKRLAVAMVLAALTVVPARAVVGPANDNFANATSIASVPFEVSADVTFATQEINEPLCGYRTGHTVWYSYTPPADVALHIQVVGSVGIYRGSRVDELNRIACVQGWEADIDLGGGKTYFFQLHGDPTSRPPWMSLSAIGAIAGRVFGPDGQPAGEICVEASGPSWVQPTTSATDGRYRFERLRPGSYVLHFGCNQGPFGSIWSGGAAEQADASSVVVTAGALTDGVDATLPVPTIISGSVEATGGGDFNICATAHRLDGSFFSTSTVAPDGSYRLFVSPGNYRIRFASCSYYSFVVEEWYDDAPFFDDARTVSAAFGLEVVGIDAVVQAQRSPPENDFPSSAEFVGSFPYRTVSFPGLADAFDNDPAQCVDNVGSRSVWYRYTPTTTTTVVVATEGASFSPAMLDAYVVGRSSFGSETSTKIACTSVDADVDRLAFVAQAGRTYLVQVGASWPSSPLRLVFDETTDRVETTIEAPIPCALLCIPLSPSAFDCATSGRYPGTFEDVAIDVPAQVSGVEPADLAIGVRMGGDADSVLCRDDDGVLTAVALGYAVASEDCLAAFIGCEETYAAAVKAGERYLIRIFNFVNTGPVGVTYSFRPDR